MGEIHIELFHLVELRVVGGGLNCLVLLLFQIEVLIVLCKNLHNVFLYVCGYRVCNVICLVPN